MSDFFSEGQKPSDIKTSVEKYKGKQGSSDLMTIATIVGLKEGKPELGKEPIYGVRETAFFRRPDNSVVGKVSWKTNDPEIDKFRMLAGKYSDGVRTYYITIGLVWPGTYLAKTSTFELNWEIALKHPQDTVGVVPLVLSAKSFERVQADFRKARVPLSCLDVVLSCTDGEFQSFDYVPQPDLKILDKIFGDHPKDRTDKVQALRHHIQTSVGHLMPTLMDVLGESLPADALERKLLTPPVSGGRGGPRGAPSGQAPRPSASFDGEDLVGAPPRKSASSTAPARQAEVADDDIPF